MNSAKKGLVYLREERGILGLIMFLAAINLVASIYDAAFPAMMLSRNGGSERTLGLVNAVIDEGTRGFLGMFGAKDAVIQVVKKFNPEKIAVTFLQEMFQAMRIEVSIETQLKDKQLSIELSGEEMGVLIGKRGQTLDSLQYLVSLVVNKGSSPYVSILLDTENYRQRRKETLESLAYNLAKKVKQTKKMLF